MKKFLLAIALTAISTAAFSDTHEEELPMRQRVTFESDCDVGVALGIYALARLEMIEVDRLLEKKRQVAELCKIFSDEDIANFFEEGEVGPRFKFGGGLLAAQEMKIDEERRNGKFSTGLVYLVRKRGECDCENLDADLQGYERLVKNGLPMPTAAELEARARENTARAREYAFVDACEEGKEIGHEVIDPNRRLTDEDEKRFNRECAGIYARADVRKTLDSMDSVKNLHDEGCKVGAETVYGEKGVRTSAKQSMHQHFRCTSISYSARMKDADAAARAETRRSRTQSAEEAFWQELRNEG